MAQYQWKLAKLQFSKIREKRQWKLANFMWNLAQYILFNKWRTINENWHILDLLTFTVDCKIHIVDGDHSPFFLQRCQQLYQKFWLKSESTPLFLSKYLSLERKIASNLHSRQKYAFRTNIEFSWKCRYLQLKPI